MVAADLVLDVTRLVWRAWQGRLPTGIDRVCMAYVERLGHRAQAVLHLGRVRMLVPHARSQRLFERLLQGRCAHRWGLVEPLWRASLAEGHPVPSGVRALYLSHSGIEHPRFANWVQRTGQRPVYFVHDLIPLTHPEYCRPGVDAEHERRLRTMLQTGSALIVNSQATLTDLEAFAFAHQWTLPPTLVAPLAPGVGSGGLEQASPLRREPYFVVIGTLEARKNHLLLLQVWRELVSKMGRASPHLVIIGRRGWECESALDMLDRCPALKGFVHELGPCEDADLQRHLRHARALLFPSFVEGFGMPVVEALTAGVPVIASDLPVFREVAGLVPDYVHPLDGPGWARAVVDFIDERSPRREAQQRRMAGYQAPTWAEHFDLVERFLGLA